MDQSDTAAVSLVPLPVATNEVPRSEIVFDGHKSGQSVEGLVLEAAFAVKAGFLLFVTDDVPFEEGLHLHLVSHDGKLLDTIFLGAVYATGSLRNLIRQAPDLFRFSFFEDQPLQLRVWDVSRFRWPWQGGVPGAHVGLSRRAFLFLSKEREP